MATSKQWNGKVLLTAAHCYNFKKSTFSAKFYDGASHMGLYNPSSIVLNVEKSPFEYSAIRDILMLRAGNLSRETTIYELADDLPPIGSTVTLHGFPGKGIPLIFASATKDEVQCQYWGPILKEQSHNKVEKNKRGHFPQTIFMMMKCPKMNFVKGYSGGPVVDDNENLIGVINSYASPSVDLDEKFNDSSILFFTAVTEKTLSHDPLVDAGKRLLPQINGTLHYPRAYFFRFFKSRKSSFDEDNRPFYSLRWTNLLVPFVNDKISGEMIYTRSSGDTFSQEWENSYVK